jgi:hypothetical protein
VRFRVERILKEIRTPSFTRIHVPFPPCAGVPRERLFLLVQTKEEWDAITDTAGGAPSADPPGPPPPDFGRKIVLLLFGGSKPSTGYVTRVEAIERKTPADVLDISFRDGLVDPDLPQSTVITHPFSAWELRKTTKNIILKNLQDSDDRVRFNLAEAALLSSLGPERAERAFAKISDKDSVVRKTSIERLQEASSEASNRAVLSSLSAERDPTVILALFRYIRSHRSTFREQAILEAVRKNPFFDGAGHSLPGAILAKQVVRYLSEYGTDESTEFLQKHYFSLACRVCPTSVLEVASLLAKRKQLTSDIAYDFIQHYSALESILWGYPSSAIPGSWKPVSQEWKVTSNSSARSACDGS